MCLHGGCCAVSAGVGELEMSIYECGVHASQS